MKLKILVSLSISLLLVLFLIQYPTIAEEARNTVEESKEKGDVELEKIVITGTKTERRLEDASVRTMLITSKDIENKGAENLYEIMKGIPGVRVEEQCSYCNFSVIRMMGMSSGQSLILIDGMPVYTGLAGVYGLQQIQSGTIDRVEIVKGAGSALYGSEAIAGVINIITKDPTAKPLFEVSGNYGSYNDGSFSVLSSTRKGNLAGVISLQTSFGDAIDEDDDGYTDRVETENIAGVTKLYWYNAFGLVDRIKVFGSVLKEFRKGGQIGNKELPQTWDNPFAEAAEHIYTTRYESGFGLRKSFASNNELNMNYHYSHHKRNATNDAAQEEAFGDDGVIEGASELPFPFLAEEFIHVGEIRYSHPLKLAGKHFFLAGFQYKRSDYEQKIGQIASGTRMKTTKEADDFGVYLQDEYTPSYVKKLAIVTGVRYDYHKSEEHYDIGDVDYNTDSVNPRGAVKYSITDELSLRGSVGTGFRVPYHFDEELHLCSGSPKIAKPSSLDPEKSVSYSISADYVEHRYYFGICYTRIEVKDKITFEPTSITGYDFEWRNMGDAYSNTIEAEAGIEVIRDLLELDLSYAFMDARYDKNPFKEFDAEVWGDDGQSKWEKFKGNGKYIPRAPEQTGSISLNLTPDPFSFLVSGRYTGALYIEYFKDDCLDDIKKTEPFWIVDTRVAYSFDNKRGQVFAGIKNLFDYVQEDKRTDDAAFMWAPFTGSKFYGGCKIRF
ncbi:MAG: TonB-dependent receptor [Spirochaetota bacterium]|nr:TonB-dependent receptor [Spirochaetota bacterium]